MRGSEELIQKNQRRVQRLLEEVQTIKKLKPDDVTKTALLKEINFEKECKKPNSTIETRAVARLATHPLLKQKITSIKDAIKAFKEARKNNTEQETKKEETIMASQDSDIRENISKQPEKPCKQGIAKQKLKAVVTKPEEGSSEHLSRKTLPKDNPCISSNQRSKVAALSAQKKGQVQASPVFPEPSADKKPTHSPEKTIDDKPENAMQGVLEKTIDDKSEKATHGVLEKTIDDKSEKAMHIDVEKTIDDKSENPMHSAPEKTVDDKPQNAMHSVPEKTIDDSESDNRLEKKTSPLRISESDLSDMEDSGKEDKEYFDDSTEERFYKKGFDFAETSSDSDDDFFLGKVRQTKQKKSHKNSSKKKAEKEIQPKESAKSLEGSMAPKTRKLESQFCGSLSVTKQKPPFKKSEPRFQPIRNRNAVPQGNKPTEKPQPQPTRRSTAVKMPGKPEPALHPSWEASKKRKEQSQIAVFQGKKIVFDD
ncbi:serum response factor-binding protein 1 isoform X2 [Hyperolius riggenbachi]|uniref:serum response factor-binding protein 1 isoform X2 n=1 Tax=Hyperolius riggenbachi TaxID=752182 RepID=UPI0035A2A2C6